MKVRYPCKECGSDCAIARIDNMGIFYHCTKYECVNYSARKRIGEITGMHTMPIVFPDGLHVDKQNLVISFARALAEKLFTVQEKYSYTNQFKYEENVEYFRQVLHQSIYKGDPIDVAAYASFLWHHDETTKLIEPSKLNPVPENFDLMKIKFFNEVIKFDLLNKNNFDYSKLRWATEKYYMDEEIQFIEIIDDDGKTKKVINELHQPIWATHVMLGDMEYVNATFK